MSRQLGALALYMRLSREDGDKAESESIENQRRLLYRYIQKKCPGWECIEYIDEGYSGTTFDRPSFQRMIADIEKGAVSGVAVKDLSRLGREYIQTGYFLENYFPYHNIRFISANDDIDSHEDSDGVGNSGLLISFKNLINDEYARDISVKVKSALRAKKESGIYACAFCRYGYCKGAKGQVEILSEEASIVQCIFRWYLWGENQKTIAQRLNELSILPPALSKGQYSRYKNMKLKNEGWNYQSVHRILSSQCYTGKAVLSKTHTISHKVRKTINTQPDKQIYCTIPTIISQEDFDTVQKRVKRAGRNSNDGVKCSFLSGLLYCASCGAKMYRKRGAKKEYFVCSQYKNAGKNACSSHYIDKEKLEKAVMHLMGDIKLGETYINSKDNCYIEQITSCDLTTFKKCKDVDYSVVSKKVNSDDRRLAKHLFGAEENGAEGADNTAVKGKEINHQKIDEMTYMKGFTQVIKRKNNAEKTKRLPCFSEMKDYKMPLGEIDKIEIISNREIIIYLEM